MASEDSHPSTFQTYVLEYVTGVLWILVLCVALPKSRNVAGFIAAVAEILEPATAAKIPDAVTGGLAAVAGIVIPYAVAMVFRPLSLWVMGCLLRTFRFIDKHVLKKQRRDLHRYSVGQLQQILQIESDVDYPEHLAYIATRNYQIAQGLEWQRNDVVFHASATLPSAVLFGLVVFRFWLQDLVAALAIGAIVYGISAVYAIQMLLRWQERAEALVLLYRRSPHEDA